MKSIRLTNAMRDQIIENVLTKWKENNPEPKVEVSEEDMANYGYSLLVSAKIEKELIDIKDKYNFSNEDDHVRLIIGGQHKNFSFGREENKRKYKLFPNNRGYHSNSVQIETSDPKNELYEEGVDQINAWKEEMSKLKAQVKSIVYSVGSTKQLRETWEEITDFIPMEIQDPSKGIKLPATLVSDLNKQIGV